MFCAPPSATLPPSPAGTLVKVSLPKEASTTAGVEFQFVQVKLRQVRRRECRYLLCTSFAAHDPDALSRQHFGWSGSRRISWPWMQASHAF